MSQFTQRQLFLKHVAQTSDLPLLGLDVNIVKAKGHTLTDVNGKEYIDLISGISVSNVGHCHPEVVAAIQHQSEKFMHLMVYGEFNQSPQVNYASLLSSILPSSLNCIYFTTSGSESVEGALKLAKRATGRTEIISFKNAYHGSTHGALSIMGSEEYKNAFRPLLPQIKQLEFNNVRQLDEITSATAAVIIEPIQGEAGVRAASIEYIKALHQRCKETGALLIFDEIQTGFGRTGYLFAFEKYGIVPDVLCIAKAMGGGMPIGAFVADKELMNVLTFNPILGHINTFGGNAVTVAAAHATLNIIIRDKLHLRALEIESILKQYIKHPSIKELRVVGALGAIDFGSEELNYEMCKRLIENGIITDWFLFCSTALRIAPPLTISDTELVNICKKIVTLLT